MGSQITIFLGLIFGVLDRIPDYSGAQQATDYSLKTISIGAGGGDLNFEGSSGRFDKLHSARAHGRGQGRPFFPSELYILPKVLGRKPSKSRSLRDSVELFLRYRLEGTAMPHFLLDLRIYDTSR